MVDSGSDRGHLFFCLVLLVGGYALWFYLMVFSATIQNNMILELLANLNDGLPWAIPAGLVILTWRFVMAVRRWRRARASMVAEDGADAGPSPGKPAFHGFIRSTLFLGLGISFIVLAFAIFAVLLFWLMVSVMFHPGGKLH